MLFILIVGTLAVVAAVFGLSMCRVAALSDRNSAVALAQVDRGEPSRDRHLAPTDRADEQLLFASPDEVFREAG
jgi:hypothetical protein